MTATPSTPGIDPDFSTSAFAGEVAECRDAASLRAMIGRFADMLGARWIVAYDFDGGVHEAAQAWTPLFSSFPEAVSIYYAENNCFAVDGGARAALESPLPVRFLEIEPALDPNAIMAGLYSLMREHGIVDSLSLRVCDRRGRLVLFSIAFDRSLEGLSDLDRRRIQASAEMLARHARDVLSPGDTNTLSPQERSVLALLVHGASNKEIARQLSLSPSTVNTVVKRTFDKLGAKTRAEAVIAASRIGFAIVA